MTSFGQTNRVNHFSHSGTTATLSIFEAADNMGCGEALRGEYVPDTTLQKVQIKPAKIDTTKARLQNSIEIPTHKQPRKGMALEQKFDARLAFKKYN